MSWDDALARIAERISAATRAHGGATILPICYGGSNGMLSQDGMDARLFRRLGASRLDKTLCAAPTGAAATGLYGRMPGVAPIDYEHARLTLLFGVNPNASGIHHVPVIERARKAGGVLVVVDPRRTPLAKKADVHLAIRPGTDLPLALALHRWLFEHGAADEEFLAAHCAGADELRAKAEPWTPARAAMECGVEAADIERVARLYAESSPAVVRVGWGLERNRNGGGAAAAVLALPAVANKFGVRGGGYTTSNSRAHGIDASAAIAAPEPDTRLVNLNQVGRALTEASDPPVTVAFVYNCNPIATLPHQNLVRQGLSREDLFVVVFEQVMTDTARYADVVLPATTFLEHDDLALGYGAMVLNRIRPVMPAVGEARSNHDVFGALVDRLGLSQPGDPQTAEEMVEAIVATSPEAARIREELAREGMATPPGGGTPIQMVDVHPRTPGGKIHLHPAALDAEAPAGLYGYQPDPGDDAHPLALISPATAKTTSSTFGQLDRRPAAVMLNRADAEARHIEAGARVRIRSHLGEVRCRAELSDDIRPGVAMLAKGLWSHRTEDGATANAVCPDTLTDLGGGATFNDARVEIEPLP